MWTAFDALVDKYWLTGAGYHNLQVLRVVAIGTKSRVETIPTTIFGYGALVIGTNKPL